MDELRIISVSGKSGLYKLLSSTKAGVIVESLSDKKRLMAPFTSISALDEIAIYTYEEEVPLWKVFAKIAEKENFKSTISHKSSKEDLFKFFREILPDFDEDQVYPSHIKKIVQWYNILVDVGYLKDFLKNKIESEEEHRDNPEA